MSIICQTFVQNAWRSDLCSNCFKSFADHTESGGRNVCERLSTPRYVPQAATLYQSRGISSSLKWRLSDSLYGVSCRDFGSQTTTKMSQQATEQQNRGILIKQNSSEKKARSRPNVDFAPEEALVIGYGGNDYDSDQSPWEMASDDGSIDLDLLDDTDEDRKITKLTKNNTEFNSSNKNLLSVDDSAQRVKREEEKLNSINNSLSTPVKITDKALNILSCVTYNDIQSQKTNKKLNQFYFSSTTECINSYLHGSNVNKYNNENSLLNNRNRSHSSDNIKMENCKKDVAKSGQDNCKNLLINDEFSPLNTRTYSFISELSKNNNTSFEQSSDSDYSTYRHTAGDSTDSESFHDAEESRILPCHSFLHEAFPRSMSQPQISCLDNDKKYDAGSSTSGDVSNLSDDSDTHESKDRVYKSRAGRTSKISPTIENKRVVKESSRSSSYPRPESESVSIDNKQPKENKLQPSVKSDDTSSQISMGTNAAVIKIQEAHKAEVTSPPDIIKQASRKGEALSIKVDVQCNFRTENCENSPSFQKLDILSHENNHSEIAVPNEASCEGRPHVKATSRQSDCATASSVNAPSPSLNIVKEDFSKASLEDANNATTVTEAQCNPPERSTNHSETSKVNKINCIKPHNLQSLADSQRSLACDKPQEYFDESSDADRSPDAIVDRQSKLAALALELEMARRDSAKNADVKNNAVSYSAPEIKPKCSPYSPTTPTSSIDENFSTIKKPSAISCASRLSSLPDVLQETPAKHKKSKFSLKKLLKRNKDSGTFTPANKESNPKAWKKQTFDRSRLSLEIVHPMDLPCDSPNSTDSTPTEEHRQLVSTNPGRVLFKGVSNRARSLSALPQLSSEYQDQAACALLECRKMDTVPVRKAGTVVERKKNRPALVRTPSCSALPNRPTVSNAAQSQDRVPPPKPPPPPKCKTMQPPPPPPPHQPRYTKPPQCSPARPPPPKIPDMKFSGQTSGYAKEEHQTKLDKDYANLGDIRSLLTPKKPQRPSAFSVNRDSEMEQKTEEIYETLQVAEEEEDHYTYLDESEIKAIKNIEGVATEPKTKTNGPEPKTKTNVVDLQITDRPWLDLQTSYAAIAAANYESLAELITASLNENVEYFRKEGKSLKWKDFSLESDKCVQITQDRSVYNAVYKNHGQDKVTLMVASRKQISPQNSRNQTRYPVFASFYDYVPKNRNGVDYSLPHESEMTSIYVLQRSRITTVSHFVERTSLDKANQHVHLRNYCFVLLQLIHTLKSLQAEGIEDIDLDLSRLILVVTDEDKPPMLVLFPEDKVYLTSCDSFHSRKTLCQATLQTMLHFLQIRDANDLASCKVNGEHLTEPVAHTFQEIAKVLSEEKASSLSQAKGFLEYMLWGPVDVKTSDNQTEGAVDCVLQRWLDLQRAQMVKSTIQYLQLKKDCRAALHVYEEYQLVFLLQASVKSLKNVISKL